MSKRHHGHSQAQLCGKYLNTSILDILKNYIFQKGVVTKVYDGDTLTFLPDNRKQEEWRIRLAEIDAPESDQPCGKESAQYLRVIHLTNPTTTFQSSLYQTHPTSIFKNSFHF